MTMLSSFLRGLFVTFLIVMVYLTVGYSYDVYKNSMVPVIDVKAPYLWTDDPSVPMTTFHRGQDFFFRTFTVRTVECEVEINQMILQISEENNEIRRTVFHSYPPVHGVSVIGRGYTDRRLTIPETLPNGSYMLDRRSDFDCKGVKIHRQFPLLKLNIE
jgi:hypothetical protein